MKCSECPIKGTCMIENGEVCDQCYYFGMPPKETPCRDCFYKEFSCQFKPKDSSTKGSDDKMSVDNSKVVPSLVGKDIEIKTKYFDYTKGEFCVRTFKGEVVIQIPPKGDREIEEAFPAIKGHSHSRLPVYLIREIKDGEEVDTPLSLNAFCVCDSLYLDGRLVFRDGFNKIRDGRRDKDFTIRIIEEVMNGHAKV